MGRRITNKERFAKYVIKGPGCWVWIGHRNPAGYGRLGYNGKLKLAHRWSYELLVGPIPDGMMLDHLCRNHACVNPEHLEPVTPTENVRRGLKCHDGMGVCSGKAKHDVTKSGATRVTSAGVRVCLACEREASERYKRTPKYRAKIERAAARRRAAREAVP